MDTEKKLKDSSSELERLGVEAQSHKERASEQETSKQSIEAELTAKLEESAMKVRMITQ